MEQSCIIKNSNKISQQNKKKTTSFTAVERIRKNYECK